MIRINKLRQKKAVINNESSCKNKVYRKNNKTEASEQDPITKKKEPTRKDRRGNITRWIDNTYQHRFQNTFLLVERLIVKRNALTNNCSLILFQSRLLKNSDNNIIA